MPACFAKAKTIMKHHPYTEIWPLMSGEDFEKFKADIKVNGLRMPVLTYKDQVLDGRNRERACEAVGVTVRYADAGVNTDAEALELVVSLNEHRRHLSPEHRAHAAMKLANIINGHNQFIEKIKGTSPDVPSINSKRPVSIITAARVMNVSPSSVDRMRAIKNRGGQGAIDEVLSGKIALATQAEKLRTTYHPEGRSGKKDKPRPQPVASAGKVLQLHNGAGPRYLTPKEVDPEFTGTPVEFVDKYGHVQVHTAKEMATMRFADWASYVKSLAKYAREMPDLGRPVDHNWLRSPAPSDVAKLTEALDYLRPKIAEAEALLARAVAALKVN
jgi:hypothetical protein